MSRLTQDGSHCVVVVLELRKAVALLAVHAHGDQGPVAGDDGAQLLVLNLRADVAHVHVAVGGVRLLCASRFSAQLACQIRCRVMGGQAQVKQNSSALSNSHSAYTRKPVFALRSKARVGSAA